jgi:EAL domain-containing protein (putative c-di-GMP-specific phosphodiesterase class I)
VLEITESAVMGDLATAVERLAALRALGVRVAMDDFGTGHSSLSYLRALPLDWIKVARPFVQQLEVSDADRALVRGIVEFAHGFGLALVAEGVETPDQHARLRGMGGDLGQGYLYDRPLEPDALAERLRARVAA